MAQNITLLGASYSNVPSVTLPKTGGGTASFTDVTDTTAVASDVAEGKYFHTADGTLTQGTATGGGSGGGAIWQDSQGYIHLSDDEGGAAYALIPVVAQQTVTTSSSTYEASVTMDADAIEVGEKYLITFDGDEYCSSGGSNWSGEYYVGDSSMLWFGGSGDPSAFTCPFALERVSWESAGSLHSASGEHTIKVERLELISGPLNLATKSITANGTYAASSDNADGYSSVTVNVVGGLVYETGTFTPTEDVQAYSISFSNTHTTLPFFYAVTFDSGEYDSTLNNVLVTFYVNYASLFGHPIALTTQSVRYGEGRYFYRGTNATGSSSTNANITNPETSTTTTSAAYPRYWVTETGMTARASTSAYFISGKTYRWMAIWAPTS